MITEEQAEGCLAIVEQYIREQTRLHPDNDSCHTAPQMYAKNAAQRLLDATDDDDLGGCSLCHG